MRMVEWKKMWELTAWDKKFQGVDKSMQSKIIPYTNLLAKDLFALAVPNGNIKLLSTGVQEGWTTEELAGDYLSEGEVVTIPWGKSPGAQNPVKYYKGKFVTGDNRIATSLDTNILNNKFLYYWMYSKSDIIETFYRGAGIQHPSMFKVLTMPVPLLSISEQLRIVGILDTFTSSIDNLKQQIAQRRKQYEYYRDQLLDLEGKEGVEMKMLGDFCDTLSGFPFDSSQFRDEGIQLMRGANIKRGYFDFSQELNKYWISSEGLEKYLLEPNDIIISMDGSLVGRSFCYLRSDHLPLLLVQRVARIRTKENYKYVYYNITKSFPDYVDKKKTAGAIPHISMKDINSFIIPVPSLSEQQRIVDILDKFETSIQNLEAQLSQREKQYEYYRNKLLTFE